ncbi:MAG TPA: FAD-dependent oxidoreductase [Terriglobales bacterium]|jgi:ferredoxin-NADP reductase|nr:FAD-dependent oxidoreductase [Terriglobales bacterium]
MAQFKTFNAHVLRSVSLSEFTRHIEFEVSGVNQFGFVPGQWLSVKANTPDGEEITRAYSIASAPSDNGRVSFCLNRVQDGFMSNYLCDLGEGGEISFQGPFGDFILRPPLRDTVFIATGTGIAPFRSMLHWLLAESDRHREHQFWLLVGARTEQDIYYHEEFERLAAEHLNFHFLPTLSRASGEWEGLRGYVQQHLGEIVGMRSDMHAYICGLDKMVKANRELLKNLGWDRTSIRYEKYD